MDTLGEDPNFSPREMSQANALAYLEDYLDSIFQVNQFSKHYH
jgi:hypothetical protein